MGLDRIPNVKVCATVGKQDNEIESNSGALPYNTLSLWKKPIKIAAPENATKA